MKGSIKVKPQNFFLVVGLIFGLSFLLLTPPFQVPDEVNHFYRAWHIAEGNLFATKQDNRLGGYMPASLIEAVNSNANIKFDYFARTSFSKTSEQLRRKLVDKTPVFVDFPNTALYLPISYFPQAVFNAIFKFLGFRPIAILMLSRLMMLILWLYVVFRVIKILPIFKWFFVFSALLPMSSFENMSVSADVVTNILGFLWIGNVFKCAFEEDKISQKNIIYLLLIAVSLACAKYVYTPLVFLVLIIPRNKISKIKNLNPIFLKGLLIIIPFVFALAGSKYATTKNIPYNKYNQTYVGNAELPPRVDISKQLEFLKANPIKLYDVVYEGYLKTYDLVQDSYIGMLGWLDVKIPETITYLGYLLLFFSLLYENAQAKTRIKFWQRLVMFFTGVLVIYLIYLSQYLSWVPVGNEYTYGTQGRYFIAVLPLVFLGLVFVPLHQKLLLYFSMVASVLILLVSVKCLVVRYYYFPPQYSEINCDAEYVYYDSILTDLCFETDKPNIVATNGISVTTEKARSGYRSSKTNKESQYGATFRLINLNEGDTLTTEVWRWGEEGILWVTSNDAKIFLSQSVAAETDAKGWNKLVLELPITKVMDHRAINIFVQSQKLCYFDDFKFTTLKKVPNK